MNFLRIGVVILLSVFFTGCAMNTRYSPSDPYRGTRDVRSIYVYSFLDLREKEIGKLFLSEVERLLGEEFEKRSIKQAQFWFERSSIRGEFALSSAPAGRTWMGPRSEMRVPVREVIQANTNNEQALGATHRLIIFPSGTVTGGLGPNFSVKWDLIDTSSGHLNWTASSHSTSTNWVNNDENALERARSFVSDFFAQMVAGGVLVPKVCEHACGDRVVANP